MFSPKFSEIDTLSKQDTWYSSLVSFSNVSGLSNSVTTKTCFATKYQFFDRCISHKSDETRQNTLVFETGISDYHCLFHIGYVIVSS